MLAFTILSVLPVLKLFVLMTSCEKESLETYYFKVGDLKATVDDIDLLKGKAPRRLVIGYNFTVYVENVTISLRNVSDYEGTLKNLSVFVIKNDLKSTKSCASSLREDKNAFLFLCNEYSRLAIVGLRNIIRNIVVHYSEVHLENYVGCYKFYQNGADDAEVRFIKRCFVRCKKTSYVGIKAGGLCTCIKQMSSLIPVQLNLCNQPCPGNRHQICGSDEYFSVYSKEPPEHITNQNLSWECYYDRLNCPKCEEGRSGLNCEFINCSVENGKCMDLKCEALSVTELLGGICTCHSGYYMDNDRLCQDLDECAMGVTCEQETTICSNTAGSYECSCIAGFKMDASGLCQDVDECLLGNACDENSTICINSRGDYRCNCKEGYFRYIKSKCQDIDECNPELPKNNCPKESKCINLPGSYDCACPKGTSKVKFQHITECQDIDECARPGTCNVTISFCINTKNSYKCACFHGYRQVDNFTCSHLEMDRITAKSVKTSSITQRVTTSILENDEESSSVLQIFLVVLILFIISCLAIAVAVQTFYQSRGTKRSLSTATTIS